MLLKETQKVYPLNVLSLFLPTGIVESFTTKHLLYTFCNEICIYAFLRKITHPAPHAPPPLCAGPLGGRCWASPPPTLPPWSHQTSCAQGTPSPPPPGPPPPDTPRRVPGWPGRARRPGASRGGRGMDSRIICGNSSVWGNFTNHPQLPVIDIVVIRE